MQEVRRYIYTSLRGQVRAHAYAYTSHNNASGQCRNTLFRILFSFSAILFKRRLIVLAISSIIILLLTYRQVTSVLPIMLLKSAKASQGKNLFIRIFAFLLLLLIAYTSPTLYRGGRYRFSAKHPTFFFCLFCYSPKALIIGKA